MLLVPLTLLLLAQAAPAPEAAPPRRTELLLGPLSIGLGGEFPVNARDAVSVEASIGPQMGLGTMGGGVGTSSSAVTPHSGLSGIFYEVLRLSVAWRRILHPNVSLDLGARTSMLLIFEGVDDFDGGWLVGAFVQPSFGTKRFRFTPSLMAGPAARDSGAWGMTVVFQPVGLTFLF